jgi:hypothetical protein
MKKALMAIAAVVIILILVAVWWLRGNMDGLVKQAIQTYGSRMTQASVTVDAVEIKATDGKGIIRGLVVGNPAGFQTAHAVKVDVIEVQIDLASLTQDVIVVKRIAVIAPNVIYEKGDSQTNFDAIQKNITSSLGPATAADQSKPGKKLIVEEFTIEGAKAEASAAFLAGKTVNVALPDIHLRDIGKSSGGVTPGELGQEISKALQRRLIPAVNFGKLMQSAGEGLEKAGNAIKNLFN